MKRLIGISITPKELVATLLLSTAFSGYCHEAPHDTIHRLSHQIGHSPRNPELFYSRAIEHKSLGKLDLAIADYRKVLTFERHHLNSTIALAGLLQKQGEETEGLELIVQALKSSVDKESQARLCKAASDIYMGQNETLKASLYMKRAIDRFPEAPDDWILQQSSLYLKLNKLVQRLKLLRQTFDKSGSVVLERAWIDAKLDNSEFKEVIPIIQRNIKDSRSVSSWNIRLSRTMAKADPKRRLLLVQAIDEINQSLNSERPDVTLIMDRCFAYHLLGEPEKSKRDFEWLTSLNIESFQMDWLEWVIKRKEM